MPTKQRVLVVDDEPGILRFVQASLSLTGYEVLTAASGEEALKIAAAKKPDLMLLDVLMAPMTGFEVLGKLRAFSQVPVIVFTARPDIGKRAIEEGASGFIAKPFQPEELTKKVKEILDHAG